MLVNNQVRFGLSTVSAENFGRGRPSVRTVSANELREAKLVAGNVPVVPTRESLRVSDRPAGNTVAARPAQERFFSKRVPSTQRESFSAESAQLRQSIERSARMRASNSEASGRNTENRPAPGNGGFAGPSRERNDNAAAPNANTVRRPSTMRPSQNSEQAQTPAANSQRQPNAGWRRFGQGAGQATPQGENNGNQRPTVLRSPRQRASSPESVPARPDATPNISRPARNGPTAPEARSGPPQFSGGRMRTSDPERMIAQNNSGNQQSNSNTEADRQNGWQRFSGGPRSSAPSQGASSGDNQSGNSSSRSASRPPLQLNRPIIEPRDSGQSRNSGRPQGNASGNSSQNSRGFSAAPSAPRQSPSAGSTNSTRSAPSMRSAPQTPSRGAASSSRGASSNGRSVPNTGAGTRGRAPERSQSR
jgi:hypothetical protein